MITHTTPLFCPSFLPQYTSQSPAPYTGSAFYSPVPLSVCPMGYGSRESMAAFELRIIAATDTVQADIKLEDEEKKFLEEAHKLETYHQRQEELRLYAAHRIRNHQAILREYLEILPFKIPTVWKNYLNNLINVLEPARIVEYGECGEATMHSILHSLIKQLDTGHRETIQLVKIGGNDPDDSTVQNAHGFALYNAKPLPAFQKLQNENELSQFFAQLKPNSQMHPLVICDPWIDFQGDTSKWLNKFQTAKGNYFANFCWKYLDIKDFSIPSLREERNEFNAKMRKFLKKLASDLLRNKVDYQALVTITKNKSHKPSRY